MRISSNGRLGLQVRWKTTKPPKELPSRLRPYLDRLARDSRRAKQPFDSSIEADGDRFVYRYRGAAEGRGALFYSAKCRRVFFLEVTSQTRGTSLKSLFREVADSFGIAGAAEDWRLFGLHVRIPEGLTLERQTLLAGKTVLEFSARGAKIQAAKWGFAEQLIARHGLEPWSRSALNIPAADVLVEPDGLAFHEIGRMSARHALVKASLEHNQITVVDVRCRKERWRPSWDWIP